MEEGGRANDEMSVMLSPAAAVEEGGHFKGRPTPSSIVRISFPKRPGSRQPTGRKARSFCRRGKLQRSVSSEEKWENGGDLAPGFNVRSRCGAVVTDFAYLLAAAAPPGAFDIGRFNDMLLRSMRASSFRHAGPGSGRTTKSIMSNDRDNRTTRAILFPRPTRSHSNPSAALKMFFVERNAEAERRT